MTLPACVESYCMLQCTGQYHVLIVRRAFDTIKEEKEVRLPSLCKLTIVASRDVEGLLSMVNGMDLKARDHGIEFRMMEYSPRNLERKWKPAKDDSINYQEDILAKDRTSLFWHGKAEGKVELAELDITYGI